MTLNKSMKYTGVFLPLNVFFKGGRAYVFQTLRNLLQACFMLEESL